MRAFALGRCAIRRLPSRARADVVSRKSRVYTHPVASSQLEAQALASLRRGLVGGHGGTVPGPGGTWG